MCVELVVGIGPCVSGGTRLGLALFARLKGFRALPVPSALLCGAARVPIATAEPRQDGGGTRERGMANGGGAGRASCAQSDALPFA